MAADQRDRAIEAALELSALHLDGADDREVHAAMTGRLSALCGGAGAFLAEATGGGQSADGLVWRGADLPEALLPGLEAAIEAPEAPDEGHLTLPLRVEDELIGVLVAERHGADGAALRASLAPFAATCARILAARRRRRHELARLAERVQRHRNLVDDLPEPICRFEPEGKLTLVNRAYAEYFGRTVAECEGLDLYELIPQADRASMKAHVGRLGPSNPVARIEHQVIASGGDIRWMQWTDRALLDAEGRVSEIQSVGLDITERKRADEERKKLHESMEQTQKLESLGSLAGGIAHEFNNLLTGILGNANLATMALPAESPLGFNLEQIEVAARRAAELCGQMLAYAGKGRYALRPLDLSRTVREIAHMLRLSISSKARLELELSDDLPQCRADARQINQALMNLLVNASDALGDGRGTITVRTGVMDCDAACLSESVPKEELAPGRYLCLEVADTGCGMDERTRARMFDPFFSTKFTGRGLGLAATLGIVRGHGGGLRVWSREGKGTTISVLLPAVEAAGTASTERSGPRAESASQGTVLVVDDEELIRQYAGNSLRMAGFEVLVASGGREALQIFRERASEIAAVLLDATMPEMDGREVFVEMTRIDPTVPVVFSSGYRREEVTAGLWELGLAGFIAKPYDPVALIREVRNAVGAVRP